MPIIILALLILLGCENVEHFIEGPDKGEKIRIGDCQNDTLTRKDSTCHASR